MNDRLLAVVSPFVITVQGVTESHVTVITVVTLIVTGLPGVNFYKSYNPEYITSIKTQNQKPISVPPPLTRRAFDIRYLS